MSYFDHVRCPSCAAHINPESLQVVEGAAKCPSCSAQIGIRDLFGLKDAFEEDDDDNMTIDDLVPGGASRSVPRGPTGQGHRASVAPAPPRAPRQIGGPGGVLGALKDIKKNR